MIELQQNNPFLQLKARSLILWFFIISFGVGIMLGFMGINLNDPIMFYVIYFIIFGLLCFWLLKRFQKVHINAQYLLGKLPQGYRWLPLIGLVFMMMVFSIGAALLSFYILSLLAPEFLESLLTSVSESSTPSSSIAYNLVQAFALVVVAPITEEFIFRGFLLHRWAAKWGMTAAIIVSSIFFGLLHINPVGASFFGMVMCLLYIKSRTLFVPMIAHAINNGICVALTFLPTSATENNLSKVDWVNSSWQAGLFLVIITTPFIIRFIYKKWPSQLVTLPYFVNQANKHSLVLEPSLK